MLDQKVESKKKTGPSTGEFEHSHPSFGMISVGRVSGNFTNHLFGCEVVNSNAIEIKISEATVSQDLGRNWYYPTKQIVSVYMSPVQYAEMISSPNTSGVPCTISQTVEHGRIAYKPIDTVTQHVQSKIESKLEAMEGEVSRLTVMLKELLLKKGAFSKTDKEEALGLLQNLSGPITSGLPFYKDQMLKSIDKAKMEAKAEIDSFVTHAITNAGIKAINNPEALKLLIEDKAVE